MHAHLLFDLQNERVIDWCIDLVLVAGLLALSRFNTFLNLYASFFVYFILTLFSFLRAKASIISGWVDYTGPDFSS